MNWEASAVIGGSAVVVLVAVASLPVGWHRRRAKSNLPNQASLTITGALVMGGMVLAFLLGAIFKESLLAHFPSWSQLIVAVSYFLGVMLLAAWIGNALEKRGFPISRRASVESPPNNRIERTREP